MNLWEKGKKAEELAARYLRSSGYCIWKTNWRWGHRELDLLATRKGVLVVVEVKAMEGNFVNDPCQVVGPGKQRNLILAADAFVRLYGWKGPTRFDVIRVSWSTRGTELEHIEGAFVPQAE